MKDLGLWVSSGAGGAHGSVACQNALCRQTDGARWRGERHAYHRRFQFVGMWDGDGRIRRSRSLAFGHPFLDAGAIEFPMATSYVHQVLPNLNVSFKLASPMQVIGSFMSDRPWGVSGDIGKVSKLIPATYTVTDEARSS